MTERVGLLVWEDVRASLEEVLWIEQIHGEPCRRQWEKMWCGAISPPARYQSEVGTVAFLDLFPYTDMCMPSGHPSENIGKSPYPRRFYCYNEGVVFLCPAFI